MIKSSETLEQQALIEWTEYNKCKYPGIDLLFAIPNGGSRHKLEAYKLKKEGVKSGVPDLFLPVAKGEYNGLFIEMKYGKNKLSEKQAQMINKLTNNNYKVIVCYSSTEAITEISSYYKLG